MLVFRITKTPIRTESLRTQVSVAGKRIFRPETRPEKAPEVKAWRSGDKTYSQNPANSGLIAGFGEISVRTRMRGGEQSQSNLSPLANSLLTGKRTGYLGILAEGGEFRS